MRTESAWIWILLFFCLSTGLIRGQGLSTEGDDFWIGFMNNWDADPDDNPIHLEIYISGKDTVNGVIEMPANNDFTPIQFTIDPATGMWMTTIPTDLAMPDAYGEIQNKGIHVSTDKNVSVYAMNKRQYSADISVILPTYSLGSEYLMMSHWQDRNRQNNAYSDAEFLILGVEEETTVEIIPSVDTRSGNKAGVPFNVTLKKGEVYQVWAGADLTGSRATAVITEENKCGQFAAFSGNRYTKVGACYESQNGHDHLYAQMYPVSTWGKEYIIVDFKDRIGGDLVKVLAAQDNTTVWIDNIPYILNAGEYISEVLDGVHNITSEKPVSVAQFSRSQTCDNTKGDPFIIMISPNEQLMKQVTFHAPTVATITRYDVNVIAKTSDKESVILDGSPLNSWFVEVPENPEYSYARITISQGNHTLKANEGFIAYVYGFGSNESFGYVTGASMENLVLDFSTKNIDGESIPIDSICWNTEIFFYPEYEGSFNRFVWDFGDGTSYETDKPDSVVHIYEKPGKYLVELYASIGVTGCAAGAHEVSRKFVHVIKPASKIYGPRSVCPNTENVAYFSPDEPLYHYFWFSEGGEIIENLQDSIFINWGETNPYASVKLLVEDHLGCVGDTIVKPVRINFQLEPEAPLGPDTLCSNEINDITYYTYFTEYSQYDWATDFGTIRSGQGFHEITMDWAGYGTGKLWFRQSSSIDTICAGTSDTLHVYIQRNPSDHAEILTDKDVYQVGEPVQMHIYADTIFQFINWDYGNDIRADTMNVSDYQTTFYACRGDYILSAVAYDTFGICKTVAKAQKTITVSPLQMEILQVTNVPGKEKLLEISWSFDDMDFYTKKLELRKLEEGDNTLETIHSFFTTTLQFMDTTVIPDSMIYHYVVTTNENCPEQTFTERHNNILLSTGINEDDPDKAFLIWNPYLGWKNGVKHYEVWLQVDERPDSLLGLPVDTEFTFEENSLGFEHCFRIKAVEDEGNQSWSWSNNSCLTFIPDIKVYNVITPNQDGKNEFFIIENIEHYPKSVLTIFNRYGKLIYKVTGYQNNWSGMHNGELLPTSVNYFVLELNEQRSEIERINGTISILY